MSDAVEYWLEDGDEDFDYEDEESDEDEEDEEGEEDGETWQVRGPGHSLDFSAKNSL